MTNNCVKNTTANKELYKSVTRVLNDQNYRWHSYVNKIERHIRVMAKKCHIHVSHFSTQ